MFVACGTQWQWSGGMASLPTGIPADRVRILMDAHGIRSTPGFWERFQALESVALDCMHREARQKQRRS